jgi:hypothetical protein
MLMLDEDRSDSGRLFYIAVPETEKVRSPNLVQVRGIKQSVLLAERNDWREGLLAGVERA